MTDDAIINHGDHRQGEGARALQSVNQIGLAGLSEGRVNQSVNFRNVFGRLCANCGLSTQAASLT